MTTFLAILAPIVGIVGVVSGVFLNELIRRRNRRETFAAGIFEKRLAIYEGLIDLIHQGSEVARDVIENSDLTAEQRRDLITVPIGAIAHYTDRHVLYIDDELASHCTALFMGVEDIHESTADEKEELLRHYYQMRNDALRMITEDSGVAEINRLFKSINRPRLSGPIIERSRELRREQRKKGSV